METIEAEMAAVGKPKLLEQVRHLLRTRRYSIRTEEAYLKGHIGLTSLAFNICSARFCIS